MVRTYPSPSRVRTERQTVAHVELVTEHITLQSTLQHCLVLIACPSATAAYIDTTTKNVQP